MILKSGGESWGKKLLGYSKEVSIILSEEFIFFMYLEFYLVVLFQGRNIFKGIFGIEYFIRILYIGEGNEQY